MALTSVIAVLEEERAKLLAQAATLQAEARQLEEALRLIQGVSQPPAAEPTRGANGHPPPPQAPAPAETEACPDLHMSPEDAVLWAVGQGHTLEEAIIANAARVSDEKRAGILTTALYMAVQRGEVEFSKGRYALA
jgi:hypothetical protein